MPVCECVCDGCVCERVFHGIFVLHIYVYHIYIYAYIYIYIYMCVYVIALYLKHSLCLWFRYFIFIFNFIFLVSRFHWICFGCLRFSHNVRTVCFWIVCVSVWVCLCVCLLVLTAVSLQTHFNILKLLQNICNTAVDIFTLFILFTIHLTYFTLLIYGIWIHSAHTHTRTHIFMYRHVCTGVRVSVFECLQGECLHSLSAA